MAIAFITHKDCMLHHAGDFHPECPERLQAIEQYILNHGIESFLQRETAHQATHEQLERVHDKAYIESIFNCSPQSGAVSLDPDTMMNPHTLNAALYAAGAVIKAVDMVLHHQAKSAFCSIRPPGHHAEHNRAMGFCFFNNAAVGIAHALAEHQLERVAIIDFDAHRGNGTDDILQNNPQVLICSLYEHLLYPFDKQSPDARNIIDLPLPAGAESAHLHAAFSATVQNTIKEFQPELIFISAGFDAHSHDKMSSLRFKQEDYVWLTTQIKAIADDCCHGRIVSVLEGGYALDELSQCVALHLNALKG